jgi:hypothetical protein
MALSKAAGMMILLAATLYGIGKTYLWPTVLGIVAERYPRGGALSLNAVSAVGMMSVGVVGTVFLGLIQDQAVEAPPAERSSPPCTPGGRGQVQRAGRLQGGGPEAGQAPCRKATSRPLPP